MSGPFKCSLPHSLLLSADIRFNLHRTKRKIFYSYWHDIIESLEYKLLFQRVCHVVVEIIVVHRRTVSRDSNKVIAASILYAIQFIGCPPWSAERRRCAEAEQRQRCTHTYEHIANCCTVVYAMRHVLDFF